MTVSDKKYDLDSFLSVILEEVVKADITMHDRQLDAWKQFAEYKPRGALINDDIDEGWAEQRYLAIDEVKFKFNVRLLPEGFFKRMIQGLRYIFGKYHPQAFYASQFIITEAENPDSIEVTITVKQEEQGKVKITYEPVDTETRTIFMNSPFLRKFSSESNKT